MKKLLLLVVFVFATAYAYHWYSGKIAPAPEATPAPVVRRATPTPRQATGLQMHSLNASGPGAVTPNPKVNPLNAPHR